MKPAITGAVSWVPCITKVDMVTALSRWDCGIKLGMIARRAGPPSTWRAPANTIRTLICQT